MPSPTLLKLAGVAGACACVGAGAGILGSADAASPTAGTSAPAPTGHKLGGHKRGQKLGGPLRRAVHAEAVVPAANGQFATVTLDRGILKSVSGTQLTLAEGAAKGVYKTVTLTIPTGAKVRDNGQPSQLAALKPGQRVVVFHGPKQTRVGAHDVRTP